MSKQTIKKIPAFTAYEIVNKLALFDDLAPEEKRLISDNPNIFYYIPNSDRFISEGELDNSFYLILNGTAKVNIENKDCDSIIAGDIVGISGFLRDKARLCSVVATSDILAIKYSRFQFQKLPTQVRETIKGRMLESLEQRIYRLNKQLPQPN